MINNEKEVVAWLNLPSIPKKKWDGKSSFLDGVAVLEYADGGLGYAIATFDAQNDPEPRIKKVFGMRQYVGIQDIYVVPSYMDENIDDMDLDERSKAKAKEVLDEAKELEEEGTKEENPMSQLPEWIFPEITNADEAQAWLRRYNSMNHIKGKLPQSETSLKLRLYSIYSEQQNRTKR